MVPTSRSLLFQQESVLVLHWEAEVHVPLEATDPSAVVFVAIVLSSFKNNYVIVELSCYSWQTQYAVRVFYPDVRNCMTH